MLSARISYRSKCTIETSYDGLREIRARAEARAPAPGLRSEGATKERTSDEGGGRGPERAEASAGNGGCGLLQAPVEYAVAVEEYLGRALLGPGSRRVYRVSLTGWAWPIVG